MIELAAATWKVDHATALQRLARNTALRPCSPEEIAGHAAAVAARSALDAFWENVGKYRGDTAGVTPGTGRLYQRLMIQVDAPIVFAGIAKGDELREVTRQCDAASHAVVQPLYSMLGQIVGFRGYRRHCSDARPFTTYGRGIVRNNTEISYTMTEGLPHATRQFDGELILMPDTWWALLLQQRHMVNNIAPIPLLGFTGGASHTPQFYDWLGNRRRTIVLVTSPQSLSMAELIRVLRLAHSMRARIGWLWDKVPDRAMRLNRPAEWLRDTIHAACSWKSVLMTALKRLNQDDAMFLFRSIPLDAMEQAEVTRGCRSLAAPADAPRTAVFGRYKIVEQDGGWYSADGKRLTNACIRINDCIVHNGVRLIGSLRMRSTTIPFDVLHRPYGRFANAKCAKLLEDLAAAAAAVTDEALFVSPDIAAGIQEIADQFHKIRTITAYARVGWDRNYFRFPSFSISSTGVLATDDAVRYVGPPQVAPLPTPGDLAGSDIQSLDGPCLPLALGLLAGVMQTAVAPLSGETGTRVAIIGDAVASQAVLRAFGCPVSSPAAAACNTQQWPVVANCGKSVAQLRRWLAVEPHGVFITTTAKHAATMRVGGWKVIDDDHPAPSAAFLAAARELPATYMLDLAKRHFHLTRKEDIYEAILEDIINWWNNATGRTLVTAQIPVSRPIDCTK